MKSKNGLLDRVLFTLFLTFSSFIFLNCQEAHATHMAGADMTYTYLGNNQYEIRYTFYRDCVGIPAQTSILLEYGSVTCGFSSTATLLPIPGTGQQITHVCPWAQTTCDGGTATGIQKWEYTCIVTLPQACPDWQFGATECCRNAAITTLDNPLGDNMYIEASLNNTTSNNNSAVFSNIPIAFECIGQNNYYNHGGYDSDGDSLVYSFTVPMDQRNVPVVYASGYSVSNPLTSSPAVSINSTTGDIFMHPVTNEVAVMAVQIQEFRNGVLIGTVIRDIQVYVVNCNNNLPLMSGINGTTSFSTSACLGSTICFDVFSSDVDVPDSLTVDWNHGIPGSSFSAPVNSLHPTGHFCWTPTPADVRSQPWVFTVNVRDNACPVNGEQTFSYSILVSELTAQVTSTDVSCYGGHNGTANITPAGSGPFDIVWVPGEMQTAHVTHLSAGTYTVNATNAAGCSVSQYITINEPPALTLSISSQDADCSGQTGHAICTVGGGTFPYTYSWNTSPPQNTNEISNLLAGIYVVDVTDDHNCHIADSVEIEGATGFSASLATTPANCLASDGTASVSTTGGSGDFTYDWNPSVSSDANATGLAAGVYTVTITDNVGGCQQTLSGIVNNTAGIIASIISSSDATCQNSEDGTATASGSGGTAPYSYLWMPGGDTSATVNDLAPGTYTVEVSDYLGCPDYATVTIGYQFSSPSIDLGTDTIICLGTTLTLDAGAGYQYLWSDNSTNQTLTVSSAGIYSVLVTDGNSCQAFDAISVDTITCGPHYTLLHNNHSIGIYPNPSTGVIDISFDNEQAGTAQISIVDAFGKVLYSSEENLKAYDVKNFDLKDFASGIYFIKVRIAGGEQSVRLIKM